MVGSAAKQDESDEEESSSGKAAGLSGMMLSCGPGSYCPLCCQDSEKEDQSQENPKQPQPRQETWMDETKITAAERTWSETVSSLERVMNTVLDDANAILQEFRKSTDKNRYQKEMAILDKRVSWATAVVDGSIQSKIDEQKALQGRPQAAGLGALTTTSDMSALSRAAPCATWEELKSIAALRANGGKYRTCATCLCHCPGQCQSESE